MASLPVYLYPQPFLSDAAWPTHAVIAAPRGWIRPGQKLYMLEDGQPMLAQVEVVATWPDGSPKWLHAYGTFRYKDGKPAKYRLARGPELPAETPASPLSVRDEKEAIHIDTGAIKLSIARPFAGITLVEHGGVKLIDGEGGPSLVDGDGTFWHPKYDRDAAVVIEQQGPAQVTVKAVGWYQTPEPRDDAFCRFTTRIRAFAGSAMVKIDHATTFADNMKEHSVAELAFTLPTASAQSFASPTLRGTFSDRFRAVYLAQLTDDRLWRILQTGDDAERDIKHRGDYERSAPRAATAAVSSAMKP